MKWMLLIGLLAVVLVGCTPAPIADEETFFEMETEEVLARDYSLESLSPEEYAVTQLGQTEPAYDNEYWDHKEDGIYVSVVSGEALFSSTHKYDSGTGWPSFTKSIADIERELDTSHGMVRTEIKAQDGAHLGHVFDDGPVEEGGARYCVNSASIDFIPKEQMEALGYGEYLYLFEE